MEVTFSVVPSSPSANLLNSVNLSLSLSHALKAGMIRCIKCEPFVNACDHLCWQELSHKPAKTVVALAGDSRR